MLGSIKAPGVESSIWILLKCMHVLLGRVVHFQGMLYPFFGKLSLEVVPTGFTSGFKVKFGVGLDSWY